MAAHGTSVFMGRLILRLFACFLALFGGVCGQGEAGQSAVFSSFGYPETKLKPFEWRYLRVDVPPLFSAVSITVLSSVGEDQRNIERLAKSIPTICIKEGSPPLPDVSDAHLREMEANHFLNGSLGRTEQCAVSQKNLTIILTNEQISPGTWYIGFFNGLGPERTQSKMISRGSAYRFSAEVSISMCVVPTVWGAYCNQTFESFSCSQVADLTHGRNLLTSGMEKYGGNHRGMLQYGLLDKEKQLSVKSDSSTIDQGIVCTGPLNGVCLVTDESKYYYLDILDSVSSLNISASNIRSNMTKNDSNNIQIMCYARFNAMPLGNTYGYSFDITNSSLVIEFPNIGRWFILIHVRKTANQNLNGTDLSPSYLCFSLKWQLYQCPYGKVGRNCLWDLHVLQRILRKSSSLPYESYYLPVEQKMPIKSASFPVGPILSNSSFEPEMNVTWTYFLLEIPRGAGGANIHFQLTSDATENFQVYARFGGVPSVESFDYILNGTQNGNVSMFLDLSDTSHRKMNFYILYAREGFWYFGVRHPIVDSFKDPVVMSISLEGCPKGCYSHGTCHSAADESGLTLYSFCACDRNHGGFDCSIELVTHQGHVLQSVALVASNAAAILPAYWALRQKAFGEWILFTSSGISSGLYHACDIGSWCVLSFRVLQAFSSFIEMVMHQFMDFWLSFMAVVSTFVYMASIDEVSKRAIHVAVSILTALMAATGPTRSENIILVVAIGALGLLIGLAIEFSTSIKSIIRSFTCHFNINQRWNNIKSWFNRVIKTLRKRFRWPFVILGAAAISAAGVSWKLESSRSYWIWHSIWHITIYTSSFFFLCSTSANDNNRQCTQQSYELARQNSLPRDELRDSTDPTRSPNGAL